MPLSPLTRRQLMATSAAAFAAAAGLAPFKALAAEAPTREAALATMKRHRALEDTIERARHYGAIARDSLGLFPASAWKHALLEAVEFAISRAH